MIFKFLKFITSSFAWLHIAASPTLVGIIFGALIYAFKKDNTGIVIAILVASIGLITGIIWASKIWNKKGTVEFMSKVSGAPDSIN